MAVQPQFKIQTDSRQEKEREGVSEVRTFEADFNGKRRGQSNIYYMYVSKFCFT